MFFSTKENSDCIMRAPCEKREKGVARTSESKSSGWQTRASADLVSEKRLNEGEESRAMIFLKKR